jgi:DNA invertase Pin-like site-specific DNA recombinase
MILFICSSVTRESQHQTKPLISRKTPCRRQAATRSSPTPHPELKPSAWDWMRLSTTSGRRADTLVVWRLDRLGRSLKHLIETITGLNDRKIGFKSITESIDTTTSGGKLVFHIFGALAEFERDIIRERTQAGLHAARARGRKGGRPKALTPKKTQMAQALYENKNNTIDEICRTLNISRATLYRYINTT